MKCVKALRWDNTDLKFDEGGLQDHFQSTFVSTSFSHHQKTVICDAPALAFPESQPSKYTLEDNPRRLVAFVGGLDITNGRWDTPNHELFSTLNKEHEDDFYQNYAPSIEKKYGPREPWHDIHCKLEGPIAYDVFQNFFEHVVPRNI